MLHIILLLSSTSWLTLLAIAREYTPPMIHTRMTHSWCSAVKSHSQTNCYRVLPVSCSLIHLDCWRWSPSPGGRTNLATSPPAQARIVPALLKKHTVRPLRHSTISRSFFWRALDIESVRSPFGFTLQVTPCARLSCKALFHACLEQIWHDVAQKLDTSKVNLHASECFHTSMPRWCMRLSGSAGQAHEVENAAEFLHLNFGHGGETPSLSLLLGMGNNPRDSSAKTTGYRIHHEWAWEKGRGRKVIESLSPTAWHPAYESNLVVTGLDWTAQSGWMAINECLA